MIVFDIDGTLANADHRLHYIMTKPKQWDKFYEACGRDTLIMPIAQVLYSLESTNKIYFMTGRSDSVRDVTLEWLQRYSLWQYNDSKLLMRKEGDFRQDTIVKAEMAEPYLDDIKMVFEDRSGVVKMWRELGITCLQVTEGDY